MKQEFKEKVGQVIQAETINQIHHDAGRLLTTQERVELNNRVRELEEYDEPGWRTWRFLHRTIGIDKVDEMRIGHRDAAEEILRLLIDRAQLQRASAVGVAERTALLLQNSQLAAKLKESQASHAALFSQAKALSARANELAMEKQHGKARVGRLVSILVMTLLATGLSTAWGVYQSQRVRRLEAQALQCEFNGRLYAVGTVIQGRPTRECVRSSEGRSVWQAVTVSGKR